LIKDPKVRGRDTEFIKEKFNEEIDYKGFEEINN
jgi:hypothetical protein